MNTPLNIFTPTEPWQKFADAYMAVRRNEGRLPDDDVLKCMPDVPLGHPHATAWKMRKHGMKKLLGVLSNSFEANDPLLDIGCGNGWLSHRMSEAGFQITGIDINLRELKQAHRVFGKPGLRFAFADLFVWQPDTPFRGAVLSSCIQYFPEPKKLLDHLFRVNRHLKTIVISDSPFYSSTEKARASLRSTEYYTGCGFPEMAKNYHHHSLEDLGRKYVVEYWPGNSLTRRLISGSPFPIITVSSMH